MNNCVISSIKGEDSHNQDRACKRVDQTGAHHCSQGTAQTTAYPLSEVSDSPKEWVSIWLRLSPSRLDWLLSLGSLLLLGQPLPYAWGCLVPPSFP